MFAARKTDNVSSAANYIEECFSVYLYTGNGSTQTITNGIDLSTYGGLVWIKQRSVGNAHALYDTARGVRKAISSNFTLAELTAAAGKELTAFNTTGFSLGTDDNYTVNANATTFASWTFRKQAKFFDVVTYTGDGVSGRQISHNLGSTPGCIIVKKTDGGTNWAVYHRGLSGNEYLNLNNTDSVSAIGSGATVFGNGTSLVAPTSSVFTLGTSSQVNSSGGTYVAYLFAHDAGGFGAAGSDNVISCGSYTGNGSTTGPIISLGWEPQWILLKPSTVVDNWNIIDNMRGATVSGSSLLYANAANAEGGVAANVAINATGFQPNSTNSGVNGSGQTYIYIAIRRGPMKTPTSGTSVFSPKATQGPSSGSTTSSNPNYDAGFPVDLFLRGYKPGGISVYTQAFDRLRGKDGGYLTTSATSSETGDNWVFDSQIGVYNTGASSNSNNCAWLFRRAPGFFDVVCYTGTGSNRTVTHNLGVAPELMIVKRRSAAASWAVYSSALGNTKSLELNQTGAVINSVDLWNSTTPTSSVFSIGGSDTSVNASGSTYVAYLFATVAGVSKVGSYTGTGTTKQIDCGFTAGARFVMIKRTDSTGDWYVWDTARGIVSGNDPYLLLNSTAAEVTNTDYIDPLNAGFEISSTAPAAINANGGTFIFLAIA